MKYACILIVLVLALLDHFTKLVKVDHKGKPQRAKSGLFKPTAPGVVVIILLIAMCLLSVVTMLGDDATRSKEKRDSDSKIDYLTSIVEELRGKNDSLYALRAGMRPDTIRAQNSESPRMSLREGSAKIQIEFDRFDRLLQNIEASIRDSVTAGNSRASARGFGQEGSVASYERNKALRPLEDTVIGHYNDCEFGIRALLAEMGYEKSTLDSASGLEALAQRYAELAKKKDSVISVIRSAIKIR